MKYRKPAAVLAAAALGAALLTGCSQSDAKTVSDNIAKEADQFNVQRKITGINGITDKVAFEVEGRCSIAPEDRKLMVTCRHGDNDYRKHYVGLSDNVFWLAEQLDPIDVSRYHTSIVIRPEALIPDFKLEAGKQ